VEYYRRQPPDRTPPANPEAMTNAAVDKAGRLLRQLLPFPSSTDASSLLTPLMQVRRNLSPQSMLAGEIPPAAGQQAASIVSEAASILDEEMAKGVLAARGANQFPGYRNADQSSAVLRQVHDVIDNIARIWPSIQGASTHWPPASVAATANGDGDDAALPNLKPASVLRPGERGTISMMFCNKEDRSVRLTPISTDLISSTGGRISSQVVEFVPAEVRLDPGEQREMQGRIAVPVECALGCYGGLLVVTGVDYLRALITIEVG
jgi:hypothetical protein